MKYHKQKELYVPGVSRGSCYPTVLACILDLELSQVPNFQLFYWNVDETDMFDNYASKLFIGNKNMSSEIANENYWDHKSLFGNLWMTVKDFWLASKGYQEVEIEKIDQWIMENKGVPYIASGLSSRGVGHVVIYMDGKMIHDPHPDGEGLEKIDPNPFSYLKKIA